MKEDLIAPCGLNCAVCKYYLYREKGLYKSARSGCPGCIPRDTGCTLKRDCERLLNRTVRFCNECDKYPCEPIKRLERRYTKKYHAHIYENLADIREKGIEAFLKNEEEKWKCPACGGTVCMEKATCIDCGTMKRFG